MILDKLRLSVETYINNISSREKVIQGLSATTMYVIIGFLLINYSTIPFMCIIFIAYIVSFMLSHLIIILARKYKYF